ncbi:MAG: PotD/PotF family extracellular solute-binding protein [Bacilli bacterium]
MKYKLILGLMSALLIFASCGSDNRQTLNILNWGEYIDQELVKKFEKEFNVRVIYEEVESSETMYSKISAGAIKYDIAVPSEYTIELMIEENLLSEIDTSIVTNTDNLDPKYYELTEFDKEGKYFVPYFTGNIGIMYNKDLVDSKDLDGWNVLWDEKYDNQVYLYDSIRDTMSVGALYNGFSVNTKDKNELDKIKTSLKKLNENARGYGTDDLKNLVSVGDGAMAVVYSGDYLVTYNDYIESKSDMNVGFYVPDEGTNIWLDGLIIPKTSENKELANEFINFMLNEKNALKNAKYVGYTSTNIRVNENLLNSGDKLYKTEAYMLPSDKFNKSEVYKNLGLEYNQMYSEIFTSIKND